MYIRWKIQIFDSQPTICTCFQQSQAKSAGISGRSTRSLISKQHLRLETVGYKLVGE